MLTRHVRVHLVAAVGPFYSTAPQTRTLGTVSEMRFGGVLASAGKRTLITLIKDIRRFFTAALFILAFAEVVP